MVISIAELMDQSGVKFGTSGARGLADSITDRIAYAYTVGFLEHLEQRFGEPKTKAVALAGDLRPSTPRIVAACATAAADLGYEVHYGGEVPSPAVALYGITRGIPAIMVTGSHIPDDRNGIKFNRADGEIDKDDEAGMRKASVALDESRFDAAGKLKRNLSLTPTQDVEREYKARFLTTFGADALTGLHVGVYQHSTVGRDLLVAVLEQLGAKVTALGRSTKFIPVDTEAVRPEDVALGRQWAKEAAAQGTPYTSIVSADGDCDRPLIADERGEWLRGDVLGVLCAQFVGATAVATPVSCNTVVERCGSFAEVARTRIGSPFVIEHMQKLSAAGHSVVVGYEANGGFLQQSPVIYDNKFLPALPTRDALLPIIALLLLSKTKRKPLSEVAAELPARFTASDRIKDYPTESSQALIRKLTPSQGQPAPYAALEQLLGDLCGKVQADDQTDGLRVTFDSQEVVHLRPSGNAPELRCYSEADTNERATELVRLVLQRITG
jgi:phosphomannomutase